MAGCRARLSRAVPWLLLAVFCGAVIWRDVAAPNVPPRPCPGDRMPEGGVIVMLATGWCPYCARARAWLQEHDLRWCELDVERIDEAARLLARHGGAVPVILTPRGAIRGFDPERLKRQVLSPVH
ncbi:MAG: glutaredoxin family protein [Gammaproteobacteria bacterium]